MRTNGQARPAQSPPRRTRPAGHIRPAQTIAAQEDGFRIPIRTSDDILEARRRARELAAKLEFPSIDRTLIASAISELGRNIVHHANQGEIHLQSDEGARGMVIIATDRGPGIRDVRSALQDGSNPEHGLGLGLPGVRRIMDEFEVVSRPRQGTTVTVKKWKPQ